MPIHDLDELSTLLCLLLRFGQLPPFRKELRQSLELKAHRIPSPLSKAPRVPALKCSRGPTGQAGHAKNVKKAP
jgi:hypothetical protein